MDTLETEVDRLYRSQFGKMLSSLMRFSDEIDLEIAEDIVQDAFSAALVVWRKDGLPVNPAGWLFKVSRNRALNKIREAKKFGRKSGAQGGDEDGVGEGAGEGEGNRGWDWPGEGSGGWGWPGDGNGGGDGPGGRNSGGIEDEQLILLFACAHPDLAPKVQVVVSLKYVVNLKVEAIAKILGLTIDGVDKMLLRARQKIRDERILFKAPSTAALQSRLASVHKILYLIFNEGYKSSWGKELIREELCEEALIMTRALSRSKAGNEETRALYALMLFNGARIKARFGKEGELLDLEEQDRSLWDQDLIRLAMVNLESANGAGGDDYGAGGSLNVTEGSLNGAGVNANGAGINSYYIEAAIAGLHCAAESWKATDWEAIIKLYKRLLRLQANPFVELNYAIALYYGTYKSEALEILHGLERQALMSQYYLLYASLGRIYAAEGNKGLAKEYFGRTLQLTSSPDEIAFVQRLINKVE
ncbi:MAG TPA: sigma-70 family RNA polymerase sigma factor [Puia sp.]|jgi:RNA polymerase sigma-70 factor (ECF subfamily)|nr:sigma-70 family RNA polymerase sigma factor [Puia sp.]